MMRTIAAVLVVVVALVAAPACASAGEVSTHVVSRVDGSDIARQLLSQVRGVEIGATAATVTVVADGETRPVCVSVDELAGGASRGEETTSDLATLAAVPFLAGAVVRLLRFLSKLGGM